MKASALVACIVIVAAFAFLAACQPDVVDNVYPDISETDSCLVCHSGDTPVGKKVLAAQDQYDNSGHLNGPRIVEAATAYTYEFQFEGGNSMYCNASSCSKCHTHQGFVDFVAAGLPASFSQTYGAASQPGCFTCHQPHVSGDFSVRKQSSETLIDGTTVYDGGKGNLCVTCHKSLTLVGNTSLVSTTAFFNNTTTFPKTWSSSTGMHHGPQADFLKGTNNYLYPSKDYSGTNGHLGSGLPDSCVSCHMYQASTSLRGGLQQGGHGMYLTTEVHGTTVNLIGDAVNNGCRECHSWSGTSLNVSVPNSGSLGSLTGGYETSTTVLINTYLDDIRANRDKLIIYFGLGANFGGAAGTGPIQSHSRGDVVAPGEWGKDWQFTASASLTEAQSYAFWNFKLFMEDRSQGIHNPVFAYRILYDAVEALSLPGGPVGTRP